MLTLSNLSPNEGAKKRKKRVGRGIGSGHGKTSGRGHKGQKARRGGAKPIWFEGGQTPIYRRIPKRGFKNPFSKEYAIVNLRRIDEKFEEGEIVCPESLREKGLVKKNLPVKVLAKGEITKKLVFKDLTFSKKAREMIERVGGRIE